MRNASAEEALEVLVKIPELTRICLTALSDSTLIGSHEQVFLKSLSAREPAVRLAAIIALNRAAKEEAAARIFDLLADPDPAVAHAAFRCLTSFKAVNVCFSRLGAGVDPPLERAALRVLGNIHETRVVEWLRERCRDPGASPQFKGEVVETLCRLYYKEADWDGSWWTTRPDTTGPYYNPVKWEGTEKIAAVLDREIGLLTRGLVQSGEAPASPGAENLKVWAGLFAKYKIKSSKLDAWLAFQNQTPARVLKTSSDEKPSGAKEMANFETPVPGPTTANAKAIANLPYEEMLRRVTGTSGNSAVGARLFESVGCVKCHTVSSKEQPKGPFLGDITARYSKEEIIESIVRPSAKIAQGFENVFIETKDGETRDGFIVRESGNEVEIRNINGAMVIPKADISGRGTRKVSIMPEGLVNALTPEDLASVIAYLRSVQVQSVSKR
jgi:putative heme-binding domain-containing protein